MKVFERKNRYFSLCGLNCALCPMYVGGYCPSCGGGEGNQSCRIAKCSLEQGGIEFCFDCKKYPCEHLLCVLSEVFRVVCNRKAILPSGYYFYAEISSSASSS